VLALFFCVQAINSVERLVYLLVDCEEFFSGVEHRVELVLYKMLAPSTQNACSNTKAMKDGVAFPMENNPKNNNNLDLYSLIIILAPTTRREKDRHLRN